MPIISNFDVPASPPELYVADEPNASTFLLFLSSVDETTQQPWCSDVRAALPLLNRLFVESTSPVVYYVYVGQRAEYKTETNYYRTVWSIKFVPTLTRYQRIDGEVKEVGRLVEGELLDEERVRAFVGA